MMIARRDMLAAGLGGVALATLPQGLWAADPAATARRIIADFTGDALPVETGITLDLPETAENGFSVPVGIDAPGATEILLVATGNPLPRVARLTFGPLAAARVATHIRLARSQDVVALARLADGGIARATVHVQVVIGGCGA